MRRRQPRPLAGALDRLTAELAPSTPLAAVQRVWPSAAPPPFSRSCTPDRERDGVVDVACPSAVEAQELALLSEQVVAALNERLPRPLVLGLRPKLRAPRA